MGELGELPRNFGGAPNSRPADAVQNRCAPAAPPLRPRCAPGASPVRPKAPPPVGELRTVSMARGSSGGALGAPGELREQLE